MSEDKGSVKQCNNFCLLVDADACPQAVRRKIENTSHRHQVRLIFITDINHELYPEYGETVIVDQGHDSVDMEIINRTVPGTLVITQDYGLASLVLAKGANAMHPSGKVYDQNNIDFLLMDRHLAAKSRRAGERTARNKKRTSKENTDFNKQLDEFFKNHAF